MIIVTFLRMFVSISGPGSLNTWRQICWLSCWGMITRFPQMPYSTSHRALYMIPSAYARSALLCVCIDFLFFIWTKIQTLYGRICFLPLVMKMEMWWIKASFFSSCSFSDVRLSFQHTIALWFLMQEQLISIDIEKPRSHTGRGSDWSGLETAAVSHFHITYEL